jgi:hypothetical protein
VLTPVLVDDVEHHLALDLAHRLGAQLLLALLVVGGASSSSMLFSSTGAVGLAKLLDGQLGGPEGADLAVQPVEVPLLVECR